MTFYMRDPGKYWNNDIESLFVKLFLATGNS